MNKTFVAGVCMFLLLAGIAFAVPQSYETSSVSRIVGNSPGDLKQQLLQEDLALEHATFYAYDQIFDSTEHVSKILRGNFPNNFEIHERFWDWDDVDDSVDDFVKNELFIVEGSRDQDNIWNINGLTPSDVSSWRSSFQSSKPLFLFDAPYAGLYLPKQNSFVGELAPYANLIAPTAYPSKEMVKSFVCNLKESRSLGEAFRQARNNYYWGVDTEDEFVGLAMLSYELYGLPYLGVDLPDYDQNTINNYCEDYSEEFKKASASLKVSISGPGEGSLTPQPYKGRFTFSINEYGITNYDGYSLIETDVTNQNFAKQELVLPKQVLVSPYPLKTVINNLSLVSLNNPVNLVVPDLPMWDGNFTARACHENSSFANISFSHSYTEHEEAVLIEVNPVDVLDCNQGLFRLYQEIVYDINYLPFSSVLIDSIDHSLTAAPSEEITVLVTSSCCEVPIPHGKIRNNKINRIV